MTDQPDKISFLPSHQPDIAAGDYTIQVTQEITGPKITGQNIFTSPQLTFSIQSERFSLSPTEVHAVFPPDGSMGDHSRVLPHVVLRRSTLPWERGSVRNDQSFPWLALLVFYEGEIEEPHPMTIAAARTAKFHKFELERGQTEQDQITVIDVKKKLLDTVLPAKEELKWLAHARRRGEAELSVIIANRLPRPNGFSTAHLVSLEEHFTNDGFEFKNAQPEEVIRLVSLLRFRFGCFEPKQTFTHLLRGLDGAKASADKQLTSSLRLPDQAAAAATAKDYLALGSVPLRYKLRSGQTTAGWYHGPLAPAKNAQPQTQTVIEVADELLRYDSKIGMFDVSYAAAWELGRFLALQNKKFSVEFVKWRREEEKLRHPSQMNARHPLANPNAPLPLEALIPAHLMQWINNLRLLEGVPFSYLVPDERMLPLESIRIFWLDWYWIDCLVEGALSIGRQININTTRADELKLKARFTNPHPLVTGVILRSEVVSGWPGLQVESRNKQPLRTDSLSPNVLLCLFDGEATEIKIHQKIETLHFGLDPEAGKADALRKTMRDPNKTVVDVTLKDPSAQRVLNLSKLTGALKATTSADFALQMIAGVEEVKFSLTR